MGTEGNAIERNRVIAVHLGTHPRVNRLFCKPLVTGRQPAPTQLVKQRGLISKLLVLGIEVPDRVHLLPLLSRKQNLLHPCRYCSPTRPRKLAILHSALNLLSPHKRRCEPSLWKWLNQNASGTNEQPES